MKYISVVISLVLFLFTGCAHTHQKTCITTKIVDHWGVCNDEDYPKIDELGNRVCVTYTECNKIKWGR